ERETWRRIGPRKVETEIDFSSRGEISAADIFYLYPTHLRIAESNGGGGLHVTGQSADRRKDRFRAPGFQLLQSNRVQRYRIFAGIKSRMMNRKVRLRLRTAAVLRQQTVHDVENDFLGNHRVGINDRDTFRAERDSLRESSPVIDVRQRHVVKTTGD